MGVKELWNKVRKGVKAGVLAIQDNTLNDNKVKTLIQEFNNSAKRKWMIVGDKYYQVENDIFYRKITKKIKGVEVEETHKANNKLAHAKYKNMVDEKVAYLLTKDFSIKCEDETYLKKLKETLGKQFNYKVSGLGYECSNKGIGWLQPYIDEQGKFNTMAIPSEQCIPVWKDNSHTELDSMIRVYETVAWQGDKRKTVTNVEIWTDEGVSYYNLDKNNLIPYVEKNYDANGPIAHYKKGEEWLSWGKVPFVPFKNNRIELPDIKFVKSLLDAYDLSRSEAANYVEEVKNLIYILKGYGGEDITEFMRNLNENRAILIDDPEEGGVDALTPQMDITALKEHYEQLKRDLVEDGQSVNKDLDKFGASPSGVALRFMYSGLDLKCNALEAEFKMAIETLLYFVNIYLSISGSGTYKDIDVEIIFNRDMQINETEVITNCNNSKGTISDKTIIGNHPWVKDIEAEQNELEKQNKVNLPFQDKIPIGGEGNEE